MKNFFSLLKKLLIGILIGFAIMLTYYAIDTAQMRSAEEAFLTALSKTLVVSSSSFVQGGTMPVRCTCDGGETHPALRVDAFPQGTQSVVVLAYDFDAPSPNFKIFYFRHWGIINLPPTPLNLQEGPPDDPIRSGQLLQNDFGKLAWIGPCPPFGQHRYTFRVFALRTPRITLAQDATYIEVLQAMQGHVLAYGELIGVYEK